MIRRKSKNPSYDRIARNSQAQTFLSTDWLAVKSERDEFKERRASYVSPKGILRFSREVLNIDLTDYQEEALHDFVKYRRYSIRAPHNAGKSTIAAVVALWGVSCFDNDVKVPITASAWRQLEKYLMPEIHKWARTGKWDLLGLEMRWGREVLELSLKLPNGRQAFALASDDPALLEGAHANHLIYIFDEAKAIPVGIWDAAEGALSSGDVYALSISTPGERSGRFYDIQRRAPGTENWRVRHITLAECIAAGRIEQQWVDEMKALWGEESAVYKNRVEGEFGDDDSASLIPLRWVELSNERWRTIRDAVQKGTMVLSGNVSYGIDPADQGDDETAFAKKNGNVVEFVRALKKQDPMKTAGEAVHLMRGTKGSGAIDAIGIGAGIYSRLRELKYPYVGVNSGKKAVNPNGTPITDHSGKMTFVNLRCALWWMLREALDPNGSDPIALPPDDKLIGDLTAPLWTIRSNGDVWVESKKEMRERLQRSPDRADAVALAIYAARYSKLQMI